MLTLTKIQIKNIKELIVLMIKQEGKKGIPAAKLLWIPDHYKMIQLLRRAGHKIWCDQRCQSFGPPHRPSWSGIYFEDERGPGWYYYYPEREKLDKLTYLLVEKKVKVLMRRVRRYKYKG